MEGGEVTGSRRNLLWAGFLLSGPSAATTSCATPRQHGVLPGARERPHPRYTSNSALSYSRPHVQVAEMNAFCFLTAILPGNFVAPIPAVWF